MALCVPGQGRRGLRAGFISSSSSCSHLRLTHEVGTTRGRLELARCKSPSCRQKSRRRMRQRVLRGLKQQGFWVPDDDSPAVDRGAATSSSGGAARAPEAEAKPPSRPPFISRIEVDAVASVRDGQLDVEPHQFYCSTGIMVPERKDSEPYMVVSVLDSGAGILCVSEATVCAL